MWCDSLFQHFSKVSTFAIERVNSNFIRIDKFTGEKDSRSLFLLILTRHKLHQFMNKSVSLQIPVKCIGVIRGCVHGCVLRIDIKISMH